MQVHISLILIYTMLVQACGGPSSSPTKNKPTTFADAKPATTTPTFSGLSEPIEIMCDQAVNGELIVTPAMSATWNFSARNSTGAVPIKSITASPQPSSMSISGSTVTFAPASPSDYVGMLTVVAGNGTATNQRVFSWRSNGNTMTQTSDTSLSTMLLPMMLMMIPTLFGALGGIFGGGGSGGDGSGGGIFGGGGSGGGGSVGGGGCANGQCNVGGGGGQKTSKSSAVLMDPKTSSVLVGATNENDAIAKAGMKSLIPNWKPLVTADPNRAVRPASATNPVNSWEGDEGE